MSEDFTKNANITQDDISDSVSILSVTFITLQPVSTAIGRRIGPKYWIALMMTCWGSVCMAHAGVRNRSTLIALRLLLGGFEAGFVPTSFVGHKRRVVRFVLTSAVLSLDPVPEILSRLPLRPFRRHVLRSRCLRRPHRIRNLSDQFLVATQLAASVHH